MTNVLANWRTSQFAYVLDLLHSAASVENRFRYGIARVRKYYGLTNNRISQCYLNKASDRDRLGLRNSKWIWLNF
jgi:hypothetical protein